MNYKANQFVRKALAIKELRGVEREYSPKLHEVFNAQTKGINKVFLQDCINYWQSLNVSFKDPDRIEKESKEEVDSFNRYIDEQIKERKIVDDKDKNSDRLKQLLAAMWLLAMAQGLLFDKRALIAKLRPLAEIDPRVLTVIEGTNLEGVKITDPQTLSFVDTYTNDLTVGLNIVQRERIRNYVKNKIIASKTVEEILGDIPELELMNARRAATVARTEIPKAKSAENRIYAKKRNIQQWVWHCNAPEDVLCIIACGVIRNIGEAFPNGLSMPTVHPNCECWTEFLIPTINHDKLAIMTFVNVLVLGHDWLGK